MTVCSKVVEILLPIARKWHLLSRYLNFPDGLRNKIASVKDSDERKLEVMIREWWHLNRGQERGKILCGVLLHSLKEEGLARLVWKRNDEGVIRRQWC